MESLPHAAIIVISTLPLLGLGIIAVVLLSLATNRDRWILPGTVIMIVAAAGWGTAMEYGPKAMELLANMAPAEVASVDAEAAPSYDEAAEEDYDDFADAVSDENEVPEAPDTRKSTPRRSKPKWVAVTDKNRPPIEESTRKGGRRTVVVNPAAEPARPKTAKPAKRESTRPKTTRPVAIVPPKPTPPPPKPIAPRPKPTPPPPKPEPKPVEVARNFPSAGGSGTLVIKIAGPLIETSQGAPASYPHILVILDGRKVELKPPTRTTENRQGDSPGGALLAVTYFWENVTITFKNLEAGWHMVLIDTALDAPRSHQSRMTGSGQAQNDYNGAIEVKAGKTTVMQFSTKHFMTGKFPEPRIR
jgi:hypothetical protein